MLKYNKILIIRTSALGDVAMTLTVIYPLCKQHPDTQFYLLTRPFFAKICINKPDNLHIIEADFKNKYRGIKGLIRCIRHLREYQFTAVADLHNVLRSWIIDKCLRAQGCKVAMVDKKRSSRRKSAIKKQQTPFIQRYAEVFDKLGYHVDLDFKSVFSSTPSLPIEIKHPAVGMAPFARYINKTYPLEQMQQVVDHLSRKGINVYLFGAKGKEAQVLEAWQKLYPNAISLAGKTDIASELALISAVDLMVTMDSANHHLASLTGTRALSIWGSTTPACGFAAYGQNSTDAIFASLDCQPCTAAGSDSCRLGTYACMRLLTPDKILRHILSALDNAPNNNSK